MSVEGHRDKGQLAGNVEDSRTNGYAWLPDDPKGSAERTNRYDKNRKTLMTNAIIYRYALP